MSNEWGRAADGLDLVDFKPDYTKSLEENRQIYREKFFKVFGRYPPEPKEESLKQ